MVMAWGLGLEHKKLLHAFAACLWQFMAWWLEGRSLNINRLPGGLRQVASMMSCTVVGLLALLCRSNIQCLRDLGCASKLRFYGHPSNFRGCWWWALQCGFSRQIFGAKMAKLLSKARECRAGLLEIWCLLCCLWLRLGTSAGFRHLIAPKLGWSHELTACYRSASMATLQGSWKYCGTVETLYRFMWVAWLESSERKKRGMQSWWMRIFSCFFFRTFWSPFFFDFPDFNDIPDISS